MKLRRFAVTALLAAASMSVVAGTANGAPADPRSGSEYPVAQAESTHGTDSGVDYIVSGSDAGEPALRVSVVSGRFALNGSHLDISDNSGQLIGQVPLTFRLADRVVSFTAQITDSERDVTIVAAGPAADIAQEPLTPEQRTYCWNATVGATIGVIVGVIIGFPLLLPGMLAGTIIGGLVGMGIAMSGPMPGEPSPDLVAKYIRCQQGMSPFGG